ncbi:MAG TPA: SCO family protein [Vicinamibacterales bacterium]|nr:SCO family protein [Vicinamibacterales bacterium]
MQQAVTGIVAAVFVLLAVTGSRGLAQTRHTVTGLVVAVDQGRTGFVVSHDAIPGVMAAMTMPFEVRDARELSGVVPGAMVMFSLVLGDRGAHAEQVRVQRYQSVEQDPLAATRLTILREAARARSSPASSSALTAGAIVPDFELIDQIRRPVTLSQFRGKVVAINFIYTACAYPQFCFRIANHFGVLQRRFSTRLSVDLVLLTITFDPARDQPEVLAEYAKQWQADPDDWRFLSGPVTAVQQVTDLFGVRFYPDEGLLNHTVRTAVVGRDGRLVALIEGNQHTAAQLGDLVQGVIGR